MIETVPLPDRLRGEPCQSCETVPEPSNPAEVMTADGRGLHGIETGNGDGALLCLDCVAVIEGPNCDA